MKLRATTILVALVMLTNPWTMNAALVTGNPQADGWVLAGNSLENGVYVRSSGTANYGFDVYSRGMTISSGSNLEIPAGSMSWLAGDTVLGVGGVFQSISPLDAGWSGFTGNAVNSLLSGSENLKLQAKFGSANDTWAVSTIAPNGGNGLGSLNQGGDNAIQVRTTGSRTVASYATDSGTLTTLASSSHITWANVSSGNPTAPNSAVARLIWNFDTGTGLLTSWEILLNASLLDRLYDGGLPAIGDSAILTVQNGDGAYTDAWVGIAADTSAVAVPEPSTYLAGALLLLPFGASTLRVLRKKCMP